jgi:hypothetical protein
MSTTYYMGVKKRKMGVKAFNTYPTASEESTDKARLTVLGSHSNTVRYKGVPDPSAK